MHRPITVTAVVMYKPTVSLVIVNLFSQAFVPSVCCVCYSKSSSLNMQVCYQGAMGAFVVFDVTQSKTFEAVQMWKEDVDNKLLLPNGKHIPAVLLANKVTRR